MLRWAPGYTQSELEDAQTRWDLPFPPDMVALYRERRPILPGNGTIDWVTTPAEKIKASLAWPLEGFWFDVVHNNDWWPEWGERPAREEDRYEVLKAVFAAAPKLIPIYGHRYLPTLPHEAGNPVFSIYQMDVIHYGSDLMDYFEREAFGWGSKPWPKQIKHIPFWSLAVG